jgi:hypothetical protein
VLGRHATARLLHGWINRPTRRAGRAAVPHRTGGHLSRDAVAGLLNKHVTAPAEICPALESKNVTPHPAPYRRSGAAARWRRHLHHRALARARQHEATDVYLHADLALKEKALLVVVCVMAASWQGRDGAKTTLLNAYPHVRNSGHVLDGPSAAFPQVTFLP